VAVKEAPELGTYNFVMRTIRPYSADLEMQASTYDESVTSRDITHPDGIRKPTIFLSTETARNALRMRGWEDVSEAWFEHHRPAAPQAEPEAPKRRIVKG
jgi:hypothetical protein